MLRYKSSSDFCNTSTPSDKIFVGYGDYFFRLLYHMKGCRIREVPVVYGVRKSGESKTNILKMGQQYGIGALNMRFKK